LAPPFLLVPSMESEPPGHRVLAALGTGADAAGAAADGMGQPQEGKARRRNKHSEKNQGRTAHAKNAQGKQAKHRNASCAYAGGEDDRDTRARPPTQTPTHT
jgi:hypothetical protein